MRFGYDYSASPIAARAIVEAGASYVIRYVDDPHLNVRPKLITSAEYQELLAAGLGVYLVFEIDTYDYTGSFLGGVEYATRALAGAEAIGYPGLIFMAVDTHLNAAQLPIAIDYIDGAARVLGDRIAVYGFSELIEACAMQGLGTAYWLCGSRPASNSPAHVWQDNTKTALINGTTCDIDWTLKPLPDGGDDLAAVPQEEWDAYKDKVDDIHGQLCTPLDPWPGGMSNVENEGKDDPNREKYFPVQTILRDNVTLTQLSNMLKAVSVGEAGQFGSFSQDDIDRFAQAVASALAALLSSKLAAPGTQP